MAGLGTGGHRRWLPASLRDRSQRELASGQRVPRRPAAAPGGWPGGDVHLDHVLHQPGRGARLRRGRLRGGGGGGSRPACADPVGRAGLASRGRGFGV